jgi:hypothetical protein
MAKMFAGKESKDEEMAEAKALKSGKITKQQYMNGEKSEGEDAREAKKNANAIKSGKLSPKQYAAKEQPKKMANGGAVKHCADGGFMATRSQQDYGK